MRPLAALGREQAARRVRTPDGLPFVGTTEIDGLQIATGDVANGRLLAPLCARLVADALGELRRPGARDRGAAGPEGG